MTGTICCKDKPAGLLSTFHEFFSGAGDLAVIVDTLLTANHRHTHLMKTISREPRIYRSSFR